MADLRYRFRPSGQVVTLKATATIGELVALARKSIHAAAGATAVDVADASALAASKLRSGETVTVQGSGGPASAAKGRRAAPKRKAPTGTSAGSKRAATKPRRATTRSGGAAAKRRGAGAAGGSGTRARAPPKRKTGVHTLGGSAAPRRAAAKRAPKRARRAGRIGGGGYSLDSSGTGASSPGSASGAVWAGGGQMLLPAAPPAPPPPPDVSVSAAVGGHGSGSGGGGGGGSGGGSGGGGGSSGGGGGRVGQATPGVPLAPVPVPPLPSRHVPAAPRPPPAPSRPTPAALGGSGSAGSSATGGSSGGGGGGGGGSGGGGVQPLDDSQDDDGLAAARRAQQRRWEEAQAAKRKLGKAPVEGLAALAGPGALGLGGHGVGGGSVAAVDFLRRAAQFDVAKQYEIVKANQRLAAAMSGDYEFQAQLNSRTLGTGAAEHICVRFSRGLHYRSWDTDTIPNISRLATVATLRYILDEFGTSGREMLKPYLMSRCSPRVFWSVVRYGGGDVPAALKSLVPGQDWSFLQQRTRKLSSKALENLRQKHEAEAELEARKQLREAKAASRKVKKAKRAAAAAAATAGNGGNPAASAGAGTEAVESAAVAGAGGALPSDGPVTMADVVDGDRLDAVQAAPDCTTVYCDRCHKARLVRASELPTGDGAGDDDPWYCHMLPRIGLCAGPDDEVEAMVGRSAAEALASAGVLTRRQLSDASVAVDLAAMSAAVAAAPHPTAATAIASLAVVRAASQVLLRRLPPGAPPERRAAATDLSSEGNADALALEWVEAARAAELPEVMPAIVEDERLRGMLEACGVALVGDLAEFPPQFVLPELRGSGVSPAELSDEEFGRWHQQARKVVAERPWLAAYRS